MSCLQFNPEAARHEMVGLDGVSLQSDCQEKDVEQTMTNGQLILGMNGL